MQRKEVLSTVATIRNYRYLGKAGGDYELRLASASATLTLDVDRETFEYNVEGRRFYRVTIEEITPKQAAEEK